MKKDIFLKLEQMYYSNINSLGSRDDGSYTDVPNISADKEYKTYVEIPPVVSDALKEYFEEPEIKTKKGKNILREPPVESDEIEDVELLDNKGNEIDIEDLDRSEVEEMINVFEDSILEQEEPEEEDDNGMGDIAQDNMGEQNPGTGKDPNIDPNEEQPDPNSMMGGGYGQDMSGMGMGSNVDPMTGEPKKTSEEVGKIFELKKIYSRLLAIESQLSFSSDIILLKVRKFITQSIELFETLISNIDAFKDEIDSIIIMYYEFLEEVYGIMKRYYKIKDREDKEGSKNKK